MPNSTFVIAECASAWRFGNDHLANAFRMIELAKECGADAAKFQWTSDPWLMAERRHGKREEFEILAYPFEWLEKLKAKCDEAGIEFMCTVFVSKDIAKIDPLVKRFKVASAESGDVLFVKAHAPYKKDIIVSFAFGSVPEDEHWEVKLIPIHCTCAYPTPIDQANTGRLAVMFSGLSDHTTSVISGAVAVGTCASVIEKHVRLLETPCANPDYPHSLPLRSSDPEYNFRTYVENIREAEKLMGNGEDVMQECEKVNVGRRVAP